MYLSFLLNCLSALLFSDLDLKPSDALVFYGQCQPAITKRLPDSHNLATVIKNPDAQEFNLTASSAAVLLLKNNSFLFEKNSDSPQSIASLTKLMTALVFLENNPGFEKEYTIKREDIVLGGKNNLFTGDTLTLENLFHTSLVASDNVATLALARSTGLSDADFVKLMNEKAAKLGLFKTKFVEPTGLSDRNVSTAREVARLAKEALGHKEVKESTIKKDYVFTTKEGRQKKIDSTDYLLYSEVGPEINILGGKTGYTESAGYCFVGKFSDDRQDEIISVVLNSSGRNDRFKETKSLVDWIFANFKWN